MFNDNKLNGNLIALKNGTLKNGTIFGHGQKVVAVRDRDITTTPTTDRVEIVGSTDSGNAEIHTAEVNNAGTITQMVRIDFNGTNFILTGIKDGGVAVTKIL